MIWFVMLVVMETQVDFDEAISRGSMYKEFEKKEYDKSCNLFKEGDK